MLGMIFPLLLLASFGFAPRFSIAVAASYLIILLRLEAYLRSFHIRSRFLADRAYPRR